jgi:cyclopropane-fatty-acyl-phospholipid synthase
MLLLKYFLDRLVRTGTLEMVDWSGVVHRFGNGDRPLVRVRLHKRSLGWRLPFNPELRAGEAYTDGSLTIEEGSLYEFLDLITMNLGAGGKPAIMRLASGLGFALRTFHQFNPVPRARTNVAHHYDLSAALYALFLDRDQQYSCAYFARADETLDEAQENKKRRIAAKLDLASGQRVLDIGSGWGGMALHLAREAGAEVTGITLSTVQREVSERRANETGLAERAHFFLRDYRQQTGTFDRIVSVGMFEHVGIDHYREFFAKLADLLADDGVAVLHTIGRAGPPAEGDPWIRKYIFPGGYIPSLSEIARAIEKTGLVITDIEVLRLHYAETLRHWRERFQANRDAVKKLYDERFCRMWEYYLAASETSFRNLKTVVFQIQLAKRPDAVPLTRDYLASWNASETDGAGVSARRTA